MFSFWKKKKPVERHPAFKATPTADQKRTTFRVPAEFPLHYRLQEAAGAHSAIASDLSAGGLRIEADENLIEGSMLHLEFQLPDEFLAGMMIEKELYEQSPFGLRPETVKMQPHRFDVMRIDAKVLESAFDEHRGTFAHGIAFVDLPTKTAEELQRFIHLWQINQLKHRFDDR